MVNGEWCIMYYVLCNRHYVLCMVYYVWCMAYGVWRMVSSDGEGWRVHPPTLAVAELRLLHVPFGLSPLSFRNLVFSTVVSGSTAREKLRENTLYLQPARERDGLEAQGGVARELGRRARRVRVLVRHTLTRGAVISPRSALLLRLTRVHWLFSCRHAGFAMRMERESAHTHQIGGRK